MCEEDVSFTDVKIKIPDRKLWLGDVNDVMHWKHVRRIWGILKKVTRVESCLRRRQLTFASSQWPCGGCHMWVGGSQHRTIVPLPLCWKTFKLKGNKKFCAWTKKSSSVFRVSGFLCSMYICYEHSMYVSHIAISWLWYNLTHRWDPNRYYHSRLKWT